MTQQLPLNDGDPVHEGFFDAIQELLSGSTPNLRIEVQNTTTLRVQSGTGSDQQSVSIGGKYRFITSTTPVTASLPGGLSSGTVTGSVFVTGTANDFTGPESAPDLTSYPFGLEIRSSGNPSTAIWRKVGEVDCVAGAIVNYRQLAGSRPSGQFGLVATADASHQPGLVVRGVASQTAKLVQIKDSSGTINASVAANGDSIFSSITITGATTGQTLVSNGSAKMVPGQLGTAGIATDAVGRAETGPWIQAHAVAINGTDGTITATWPEAMANTSYVTQATLGSTLALGAATVVVKSQTASQVTLFWQGAGSGAHVIYLLGVMLG